MKKKIAILFIVLLIVAVIALSVCVALLYQENKLLETALLIKEDIEEKEQTLINLDVELKSISSEEYEVIGLKNSTQSVLNIPDSVNGKRIVGIADEAFMGTELIDVKLGANVRYVGAKAFKDCKLLIRVQLNDGLESIKAAAFKQCKSLIKMEIPDSVTELGPNVFEECSRLETLRIGSGVKTIGAKTAFKTKLTNLVIGNSVEEIGEFAFTNMKQSALKIPDSVKKIGDNAFNFSEFESVVFGESVQKIGNNAFSMCINLKKVVFPNGLREIGDQAFYMCYELTTINLSQESSNIRNTEIPKSVTSIGKEAFAHCSLSNEVVIEEAVQLGEGVFKGNSIRKVVFNGSRTSIPNELFQSNEIEEIVFPAEITKVGENAFQYCKLNTLVLPDSMKTIKRYAFSNNSELFKLVIGKNVAEVEAYSFSGCAKLYAIQNKSTLNLVKGSSDFGEVARNAITIRADESVGDIINDNGYEYFIYDGKKVLLAYTGSKYAFDGIPSDVTEIYNNFTLNSTAELWGEELIIPDNVVKIGNRAFSNVPAKRLYLGTGLKEIGEKAFSNSLREIYNASTLEITVGSDAYDGLAKNVYAVYDSWDAESKIKEQGDFLVFVDGERAVALEYTGKGGAVVIEEGITEINAKFNSDKYVVTSITLPSTCKKLVTLGSPKYLENIYLNNGLEEIGTSAFYECISLKSITIPASVKKIGYFVFSNCLSLESIIVESENQNYYSDGVALYTKDGTTLMSYAVASENTTFVINSNVTAIARAIFEKATNLVSITFEDTTTWYKADELSDWENRTNGKKTLVTDQEEMMAFFLNKDNSFKPWLYKK